MKPAKITRTGLRWLLPAGTTLALGIALAGNPAQAAPRASAPVGTINTVAGGVGGPGQATTVSLRPCGVSFSGSSIYVADGGAVRKISKTGQLTTPAGTGVQGGPSDNGGLATRADLLTCGMAVDHAGNLVISDPSLRQIGVVAATNGTFYGQAMKAGHIYKVAGSGKFGFSPSGAPAMTAKFADLADVAVDGSGNLVISESGNNLKKLPNWARVQVVAESSGTFYGQAMTAGDIYNVAGGGTLKGASANGHPGGQAAIGLEIGQVAVDQAGNILVPSIFTNRLWLVAGSSGRFYGQAMTAGNIYTIAGDGNGVFSGDGGPATKASVNPDGVAVDAAGNVVIADFVNHRIRVVAASSGTFYGQAMTAEDIYTIAGNGTQGFAGNGGPARAAELSSPQAVAVDPATGDVVIGDLSNGGIDGEFGGLVRVVAGSGGTRYGQAMTAGDIYQVGGLLGADGEGSFSGDGGPATRAQLDVPFGVTVDAAGNWLIADDGNNRIRVVATSTGRFYGQAMTAGNIYTVAGDGTLGFSGDGGPATGAELSNPEGVTVDRAGNLVIADNLRVRVVAVKSGTFYSQAMTAGHIYTVAGDGNLQSSGDGGPATSAALDPTGIGVDSLGNLVVTDNVNSRVRVVAVKSGTFYGQAMTAGNIYTVAGDGNVEFSGDGGRRPQAGIGSPQDVAVDAAGNVLISDSFNNRVRVVAASNGTFYGQAMTAGDIYTVAGDGQRGSSGDGGLATAAAVGLPEDITLDAAGNVLIASAGGGRVRVAAARTGTFYQQSMIKGDIYTVAGNSTGGFTGDGGPATSAGLTGPDGVTVDGHGNLLISDSGRIRMITG